MSKHCRSLSTLGTVVLVMQVVIHVVAQYSILVMVFNNSTALALYTANTQYIRWVI